MKGESYAVRWTQEKGQAGEAVIPLHDGEMFYNCWISEPDEVWQQRIRQAQEFRQSWKKKAKEILLEREAGLLDELFTQQDIEFLKSCNICL